MDRFTQHKMKPTTPANPRHSLQASLTKPPKPNWELSEGIRSNNICLRSPMYWQQTTLDLLLVSSMTLDGGFHPLEKDLNVKLKN